MQLPPDPNSVFATHPLQLSRWLEQAFANGGQLPVMGGNPLGNLAVIGAQALPANLRNGGLRSGLSQPPPPQPNFNGAPANDIGAAARLPWDHLIYAYLIESTGVVDVFGEVVRRFSVGETLEAPTVATLEWARATEELFFRDPPLFHILGLTSSLRPNGSENRRNAYWRMFGCDLPQTLSGGVQPWKRDVGSGANTRFMELFTELLRQIQLAIYNAQNAVGANPTDDNYIAYLCQTLGELMGLRRITGMFDRTEFAYVSMMSWFHLTVEHDTPVVQDLRALAGPQGNPADRLRAIANRVGMTVPRQARELFELADLLSVFFWTLELGVFANPANVQVLYLPANGFVRNQMQLIIDLWQSATGERIKDMAVTVGGAGYGRPLPATGQPTRLPVGSVAPTSPALAATNGRTPAQRP